MCTLLDEKTRRARKPHECYACGATINPGEEYYWEKYVNCDGLYELKSCLVCDMAFSEVWDYVGEWRCISDEVPAIPEQGSSLSDSRCYLWCQAHAAQQTPPQ